MVTCSVLFELVPPRRGVVTLLALEGALVVVDPLVTDEVGLLKEPSAADCTGMRPDSSMTPHVRVQLRLFRGRVLTLRVLAPEHFSGWRNYNYREASLRIRILGLRYSYP
jgi:hypothetical protein